MEEIKRRLRQLKLSGAVKALEGRNEYALKNKVSYLDFLELVLKDEWVTRQSNAYHRRLLQSKLNEQNGWRIMILLTSRNWTNPLLWNSVPAG